VRFRGLRAIEVPDDDQTHPAASLPVPSPHERRQRAMAVAMI
jgi:hypothetical protein